MKKIIFILFLLSCTYLAIAETPNEITLTSTGIAQTEKEAILEAQRSALEQTYGTFVSANTELLNDEIVKDEIVSVSKGNVKSYKKLSSAVMPNGQVLVTIETTISIGKLVSFAKSKGSSAELAGQDFAMDLKMKRLRAQNTEKCLDNLKQEIAILLQNAFDFEIVAKNPVVEEPHSWRVYSDALQYESPSLFKIETTIRAYANETGGAVYAALYNTISSLDIGESATESYEAVGVKTSFVTMGGGDYEVKDFYLPVEREHFNSFFRESIERSIFCAFFNYSIEIKGLNQKFKWQQFANWRELTQTVVPFPFEFKLPNYAYVNDYIYLCDQETSPAWYSISFREGWTLTPFSKYRAHFGGYDPGSTVRSEAHKYYDQMANWSRCVPKKKNQSQKKEVKSRKKPDLHEFLTGLKRNTSEENQPKANKTEETSDKHKEAIFSYKIPFYVTEEAVSLIQGIEIIK